jgi:hypothetical protein
VLLRRLTPAKPAFRISRATRLRLTRMAAAGCEDAIITAVMLDTALPIGAHVRDQPNCAKYLEKQIANAREQTNNSTPPVLPQADRRRHRHPIGNSERLPPKTEMLLAVQGKELELLFYMRQQSARSTVTYCTWISEIGIDLNCLYDPLELGELIDFTVPEDVRFATEPLGRREKSYLRQGRRVKMPAARFPRRLMPAGFSKAETQQRRKAFHQPKRNDAERQRRAIERATTTARMKQAADLNCRHSAVLTAVPDNWTTTRKLAKEVAKSEAFKMADGKRLLTGDSLRRAIARALETLIFKQLIEKHEVPDKRGFTVARFRRRPAGLR